MDFRGLVDRLSPRRSTGTADAETSVAVACQGGGSHAAFTAGALGYLLENLPDGYVCRGLSGTSGGAVSATTAWYGHVADGTTPSDLLESLWMDVAATSSWDRWVNSVAVTKAERGSRSGTTVSPYATPGTDWGRRQLESVLTDHVDFEALRERFAEGDPPALLVGAVDVETGRPTTFADASVGADAVLASAAVPTLFEAVEVDDRHYWDGLFGKNPPIRELVTREAVPAIDELWVIQLTPERADGVPKSARAIDERMRHLVGNLSLRQEIAFVEALDEWREKGHVAADAPVPTTVRTISLYDEQAAESMIDRDAAFVRDLFADGRAEAVGFLNEVLDGEDGGTRAGAAGDGVPEARRSTAADGGGAGEPDSVGRGE